MYILRCVSVGPLVVQHLSQCSAYYFWVIQALQQALKMHLLYHTFVVSHLYFTIMLTQKFAVWSSSSNSDDPQEDNSTMTGYSSNSSGSEAEDPAKKDTKTKLVEPSKFAPPKSKIYKDKHINVKPIVSTNAPKLEKGFWIASAITAVFVVTTLTAATLYIKKIFKKK